MSKVNQKYHVSKLTFPILLISKSISKSSVQKFSFTLPASALRDFKNISNKFLESLSRLTLIKNFKKILLLVFTIANMNPLGNAYKSNEWRNLLVRILALRRLFHSIKYFNCFIFFIYLVNLLLARVLR